MCLVGVPICESLEGTLKMHGMKKQRVILWREVAEIDNARHENSQCTNAIDNGC